jgi:hypothetical protein
VKAFAQQQLEPHQRVVVYCVSGKPDLGAEVATPKSEGKDTSRSGGDAVNADAAWRENAPKPGPERPLHLPVPEQFKLSNGLTVFYHEQPAGCSKSGVPAWRRRESDRASRLGQFHGKNAARRHGNVIVAADCGPLGGFGYGDFIAGHRRFFERG